MSLTVTQANDVNVVLDALLGTGPYRGEDRPPSPDEVWAAAQRLADASNARLMAGWSSSLLERQTTELGWRLKEVLAL